jgi:hypothetical protein
MHMVHNFCSTDWSGAVQLLTASYEGVQWVRLQNDARNFHPGNQENPNGARGSSEIKLGFRRGEHLFIATIEPFHGHQVVVYSFKKQPFSNERVESFEVKRAVLDEKLKSGHALWCADLDTDGQDEVIAGFRDPTDAGVGPGINIYKAWPGEVPRKWDKHVLDDKGIACEDLACADLNNDGKIDIVACGRATGNVRIYWNQGMGNN